MDAPGGKSRASGRSGSGASQPAALSSAAQKLVSDIREFGRMPKQNKGTSEEERAENRLAKRFSDHQGSIPNDVLRELGALGGAPWPAALPPTKKRKTTHASSESNDGGASQPAAFSSAARKVVEDIRTFGRMPRRNQGNSEDEKAENKLARRFEDHRNNIPNDVLQELRALGAAAQAVAMTRAVQESDDSGASQPAAFSSAAQNVVEDIRKFGRMPKRNQGTSEDELAENRLARRFEDHRNNIPDDVLKDLRFSTGVQQMVKMVKQILIDKKPIPAHMWPSLRLCIEDYSADIWQEVLLLAAHQPGLTAVIEANTWCLKIRPSPKEADQVAGQEIM